MISIVCTARIVVTNVSRSNDTKVSVVVIVNSFRSTRNSSLDLTINFALRKGSRVPLRKLA